MTIDTSIRGNAAVVALVGRMDADQASEFERACEKAAAQGVRHVVADLSGLSYVSSMGLRAFLALAQSRKAAGGELVLVGLAGFVKQVFDLTRITPLMRTAPAVDAALAELP
jgi:anti-anti-sigma factor